MHLKTIIFPFAIIKYSIFFTVNVLIIKTLKACLFLFRPPHWRLIGDDGRVLKSELSRKASLQLSHVIHDSENKLQPQQPPNNPRDKRLLTSLNFRHSLKTGYDCVGWNARSLQDLSIAQIKFGIRPLSTELWRLWWRNWRNRQRFKGKAAF